MGADSNYSHGGEPKVNLDSHGYVTALANVRAEAGGQGYTAASCTEDETNTDMQMTRMGTGAHRARLFFNC